LDAEFPVSRVNTAHRHRNILIYPVFNNGDE